MQAGCVNLLICTQGVRHCLRVQPVASLALNGQQLRKAQQQSSVNLWQPDVAAGLLLLCRPESGKRHACCIGSTLHLDCGHAQAEYLLPLFSTGLASAYFLQAGHDTLDISRIFSFQRGEQRAWKKERRQLWDSLITCVCMLVCRSSSCV